MNKNTRNIRAAISKASKKGNATVTFSYPVKGYFSAQNKMTNKTFPCAVPNGDGVISANERRNTQMVVFTNVDNTGKKFSVTQHVAINPKIPVRHKNHNYLTYRQGVEFGGRME